MDFIEPNPSKKKKLPKTEFVNGKKHRTKKWISKADKTKPYVKKFRQRSGPCESDPEEDDDEMYSAYDHPWRLLCIEGKWMSVCRFCDCDY